MNKAHFIEQLSLLRPSSTFLCLHQYRNQYGEVANHNISFHISYANALKRSIEILEVLAPQSKLEEQAHREVLKSFYTSLKGCETPIEEINDAYIRFLDDEGQYIKGVKMHEKTGTLHLYGFAHQKVVLEPGVYPQRNSLPLTIEKNKLRALCPVSKFRQWKITPNQVNKISVEKISLLPPID